MAHAAVDHSCLESEKKMRQRLREKRSCQKLRSLLQLRLQTRRREKPNCEATSQRQRQD
jgi:hypothetical protein